MEKQRFVDKPEECSPRVRGCTGDPVADAELDEVFPAGAGVYRTRRESEKFAGCVPRGCGGVPTPLILAVSGVTCSPRVRGCTANDALIHAVEIVFPAGAGVYRYHLRFRWLRGRVPRGCGGVPVITSSVIISGVCSPRVRGCTAVANEVQRIKNVFPAGAGVYRQINRSAMRFVCVPRGCGGVPPALGRCRARHQVFPAGAGVYRFPPSAALVSVSVPRGCGGVPESVDFWLDNEPCSPRVRGCTASSLYETNWPLVFPAGAGVYRQWDSNAGVHFVFPAGAGVYRTEQKHSWCLACVPRGCGGVPFKSRFIVS